MTVPEEEPRSLFTCDGVRRRFKPSYELIDLDTFATDGVDNLLVFIEPPQTEAHPIFGTVDGAVQQYRDKHWFWDAETNEVVMHTAPPSGYKLVINRETYETQEKDYQQFVPFLMDGASEYGYDKVTHRIQELVDLGRRLVKVRPSDIVFDDRDTFPPAFFRLGLAVPIEITLNLGGGEYECRELIFDYDILDFRYREATDLDGVFLFEQACHELNLCQFVEVGDRGIAFALEDVNGDVHWRFVLPGCLQVDGSSSSSSSSSSSYYSSSSSSDSSSSDSSSSSSSSGDWLHQASPNRMSITVKSSTRLTGDVVNMVQTLRLSDLSAAHGFWSTVRSDGGDIRIYHVASKTRVPVEVSYIDTTGKAAEIFFMWTGTVTTGADVEFDLYYGSGQAAEANSATYGRNNVWVDYDFVTHNQANHPDDATGNGLDGTSFNTPIPTNGKNDGFSLDFQDTSSEYVSHGTGTLAPGTGDFSIHLWINKDDASNNRSLFNRRVPSGSFELWGFWEGTAAADLGLTSSNKYAFFLCDVWRTNDWCASPTSYTLSAGVWHLLLARRNSGVVDLSLDSNTSVGITAATDRGTGDGCDVTSVDTVYQARSSAGAGSYFDGTLDEIRYTNRYMSDDEYLAHYEAFNQPDLLYIYGAEEDKP